MLNLWICSWIPFLYMVKSIYELGKFQVEWYVTIFYWLTIIISWLIGIGSNIFLHKIKDHEWNKYDER